jgi:type IV secretion system protein TrbL
MVKTSVLVADIINRQGSYSYDTEKKNFIAQTLETIKNLPQLVFSLVLKLLMTFGIVAAGVIFVLQYCMCIIEYYIMSAVGVLFIPCVLFEGTRGAAKKLLPLFASYFIKITVTSLCVFWAYSAFISMGNDIIGSNQPIGFLSFANFLFTTLLCWAVVVNGPKIASGILSGSPSLGMGDFLQAAGGAVMGARMAGAAAKTARDLPENIDKGVNKNLNKARAFGNGAASAAHRVKEYLSGERDVRGIYGGKPLYGGTVTFEDGPETGGGGRAFKAAEAGREEAGGRSAPLSASASFTPSPAPLPAPEKEKNPAGEKPAALVAAKNTASSRANAEAAAAGPAN